MTVAGSVGKASRKEQKGREPANADCPPLLRLAMGSRVPHTVALPPSCGRKRDGRSHSHWKNDGKMQSRRPWNLGNALDRWHSACIPHSFLRRVG
ncbi:hypothetical protein BLNAU_18188 [Blattamonas nauphoetae]|uniref:Uncharacterized protein n=1 Tax=Blattamonas nauphoetae TaxID=2049346 RepID=A0ABQ9X534_9EUKA|nr:hypothetical protein BLNAU_18188 [Blattamonas nauphoetae]